MSDYLTLVEVLAIHADQIQRYGGTEGIRDAGLLEAALYRPRTGRYSKRHRSMMSRNATSAPALSR